MPENLSVKIPLSPAPVARTGAGDISERELSRERQTMQTTPPTRIQRAHPKKQLFSAPVNKFTGKACPPSPHLARIKSCLNGYSQHATPARPTRVRPKAVSMEDLTPVKRIKIERKGTELSVLSSPPVRTAAEELAAARVARFMVVCAWRRRREDVRCLRKTLECQVSCSERLRMQVSALKLLLDSDNCKLRLAMRELERLKQLLRDKDNEKVLLEREKMALERDVCAAHDQASEMSIGWRNCRNELEGTLALVAARDHALSLERAALGEARAQRDHAYHRISVLEEELSQHESLLQEAEEAAQELRRAQLHHDAALAAATRQLRHEQLAREHCVKECASLDARVSASSEQTAALKQVVAALQAEICALRGELEGPGLWLPRTLGRYAHMAQSWVLRPLRLPSAALWALLPARHGC